MPSPSLMGGAGSGVPARMVARDAELAALLELLTGAQQGVSSAAEVVGEAGIGKTLLLARFAELAAKAGAAVFSGRASEFERDLPFGAVLDALDGLPHGLDGSEDARAGMRHLHHRRIRELLSTTAVTAPVVFILDDLHWADGATIDLVRSLIDRPPAGGCVLVLGHRPHQAGSAVGRTVMHDERAPLLRLPLAPLGVDDAAALLGPGVAYARLVELHAACGGNPFLLEHLARHDREGRGPARGAAGVLASELAPLSGPARALLDAAAVVGDPFDLSLAAHVAAPDAPDAAMLAALDELFAADLIRATGDASRFAFRHPLVRRAVYDDITPGQRIVEHRQAADALRERGADPTALAHHVEQSATRGDDRAIEVLVAAGRLVLQRAPASAARWLGAAWQLLPEDRQIEPAATELLYALGLALTVSGRGAEALEIPSPTLDALPAAHPLRVRLEIGRTMVEEAIGRFASATRRLRSLETAIGDAATFEALLVALSNARLAVALHDLPAAEADLARAARIADGLGPMFADGLVAPIASWVSYAGGDIPGATAAYERASAALSAVPDGVLTEFASSLTAVARAAWGLGRLSEARALAQRGLALTSTGEWPILGTQLLAISSAVDVLRGRLRDALDCADAACEEASLIRNGEADFWAHTARARALEPTSALRDALAEGELGLEGARAQGLDGTVAAAGQALARALVASDLPARAIETINDTHGGPEMPRLALASRAESLQLLVSAELARGEVAAAQRWAERAARVASATGLPLTSAYADWCEALVAARTGDPARAASAAARGRDHAIACGAALLATRISLTLGDAQLELGDREAATLTLRGAETELLGFGADRLQAEAVRLLRRMGRRVTRSGRGTSVVPAEPLTRRQQEIAELAAAGHSNREIAETLFLSPKTVETHLAAAYVRLGVESRRELTEVLTSARAVPGPDAG